MYLQFQLNSLCCLAFIDKLIQLSDEDAGVDEYDSIVKLCADNTSIIIMNHIIAGEEPRKAKCRIGSVTIDDEPVIANKVRT